MKVAAVAIVCRPRRIVGGAADAQGDISTTISGTQSAIGTGGMIGDVDDTMLASAPISIGTWQVTGDRLPVSAQNGISMAYDGTIGVMSLTGSVRGAPFGGKLVGDDPTTIPLENHALYGSSQTR